MGTLVGLYETAIDKLCTWEVAGRRYAQNDCLDGNDQECRCASKKPVPSNCDIFPPPGLDVRDNFFSVQREPTEKEFGRRYLGIMRSGSSTEGGFDPSLYRVSLLGPGPLRKVYGESSRSMDDSSRLLQFNARTGRDAAPSR